MTLWIIAAIAAAVLFAGVAFLTRKQGGDDHWKARHAHAWDERPDEPEGTRLASMPPPAGMPITTTQSWEVDRSAILESTELWMEDEPTGPVAKIVLEAAGKSHPGRKREHNEDALLLWAEQELYVIADGMGGYVGGEVASQLAVETLQRVFTSEAFGTVEDGFPKRGAELMAAIAEANRSIRAAAQEDERMVGMGTTVVAARFAPARNRVYIAHVGDSRCYRLRDRQLAQLTTDHTLGAVGIQGKSASKLSRAVGVFDRVDVDLTIDEPQPGDRYLLCSDGLYKMLSDEEIAEVLERAEAPSEAVEWLVREANERGGRDNVSVVVVQVEEPDLGDRESGEHRLFG